MPNPQALVMVLANQLGATLLDDDVEVTVDAPIGKFWVACSSPQLVARSVFNRKRHILWWDLFGRMSAGLEDEDDGR